VGGGPEQLTALAEECFGGMASNSKLHNLRAGKGARNNNAFVLFYEREPSDRHMSAHTPPHTRAREELSHTHTDAAAAAARQVITLLAELVPKALILTAAELRDRQALSLLAVLVQKYKY
jgi:hypothetical protein